MEPTIAISALAKLIGLGMKGWSGLDSRGFDEKDVAAIQGLLETGVSFASMRKSAPPAVAALHVALVARSFGQAVGRHQEHHGKLLLTGGLRRWLNRDDRQREDEIELRVKVAALHPRGMGNDPRGEVELVSALTGSPLDTPYYRRLWQAFSDPAMTLPDEEPPLVMSQTARREFERYFLLAYLVAVESAAGRGVKDYLGGLADYRALLVRDLLVQDMATWGGRHMFGNVPRERWREDEPVPFLPLDELYVESNGAIEKKPGETGKPEPLLELIERLTTTDDQPRVVLVVADFGSGKSLSARMLAKRWAESALAATTVSLDSVLPIYVRCAEDFPHEAVDLAATVRRAWKRQADGFGLSVPDDDGALAWPTEAQRVVCLLDGLDEVALGDQHLKTLFQKLRDKTTAHHRFVVFSRPGAVPSRADLGDNVAVVRVQPFGPEQVEKWTAGWNRLRPDAPPVTAVVIEQLGLGEIVRTPILLFMVAFTWEGYTARRDPPSLAEIYESFFVQIAAGKAEADRRERHGPIATASEALLAALKNQSVLDDRATLPDAMLWLMGRVAWEAQMLEQRDPPESLSHRHVDNLLHDGNFRLPDNAAHAIQIGLVLALQSNLRSADHQILFGHQSFREFLIGRHWAMQLHQIVRGSPRDWDTGTATLLGGRLLGEENKSLDFLLQLVNAEPDPHRPTSPLAWTDPDREVLVRWAQEVFSDEAQVFGRRERTGPRGGKRLRDDTRAVLREAALAIGSLTRGSPGLRVPDAMTVRSMLAWFWLHRLAPLIVAPGANLAGAELNSVDLSDARFEGTTLDRADLADASLFRASLVGAKLVDADLSEAKLDRARLDGAVLTRANLAGASIRAAQLNEARLDEANLEAALLSGSSLVAANLHRANLFAAILTETNLEGANLEGANLERARLSGANLQCARLARANLERANLTGAHFDGADLTMARLVETDLRKARLVEARLDGARLEGARYDQTTTWPQGFDPAAHGAILVEPSA